MNLCHKIGQIKNLLTLPPSTSTCENISMLRTWPGDLLQGVPQEGGRETKWASCFLLTQSWFQHLSHSLASSWQNQSPLSLLLRKGIMGQQVPTCAFRQEISQPLPLKRCSKGHRQQQTWYKSHYWFFSLWMEGFFLMFWLETYLNSTLVTFGHPKTKKTLHWTLSTEVMWWLRQYSGSHVRSFPGPAGYE